MKYLIVECKRSYAVAVDEDGRFLKVANRHYQVGQSVTDVVQIQLPKKDPRKWVYPLVAMAACLALVFTLVLPNQAYASVYLKINPEVRIDVDKQDTVVGLAGVNQDGTDLIAGYDYHKKSLDLVTDELVDRAIDMGYLQADGQITISLDSQDPLWVEGHSQSISEHLHSHLQDRFVVTIQIRDHHDDDDHDDHDDDDDDDDHDDHDDDDPDDGIYPDPDDSNRIEIQPDLDDDDGDDRDDDDDDGHDDDHDDHDDDDDDDRDDHDDDDDDDRDDDNDD